jgi:aryl-alcohol dehydrogenase-like predicted oxidoreductase
MKPGALSRRQLLQAALLAGAGATLSRTPLAADRNSSPILKPIPKTGEKIPVIGLGTNQFAKGDPAVVRDVLKRMYDTGGTVINTASAYDQSEVLIGQALRELGLTRKMFISTMFDVAGVGTLHDPIAGKESVERSMQRLGKVDLMFIHLIAGVEPLMPVLQELKQQGRVRYIGITNVYRHDADAQFVGYLRKYPLDFIQVPYSMGDRIVEEEILPLAQERKIAVMAAVPFGGKHEGESLFTKVGQRQLPGWAADFNITSWSQFFLKYVVSHPAITCAVPGSASVSHIDDNQAAGKGRLPDAATRKKMQAFWETGA